MKFSILTASDSRTRESDESGRLLKERLEEAGGTCLDWQVVPDDRVQIQAAYLQMELKKT